MEDRELLELAAKACGLEVSFSEDGICEQRVAGRCVGDWNPLERDADAFRLFVDLGIWVDPSESQTFAHAIRDGFEVNVFEDHKDCVKDATRRAIVRAAAELGSRSNA